MKYIPVILMFLVILLVLVGCGSKTNVCPPVTGTPQYLSMPPNQLATPTPVYGPILVEISGKELLVDKVVEGPLCNDTWRGLVYVTCDTQVYAWEEQPTFLKDCNLNIEPDTIAYVAYHNDTAYYKGCSCHTGETPEP